MGRNTHAGKSSGVRIRGPGFSKMGAAAFIWFEFLERIFGLDKRRAFDEMDKMRKDRVDKVFKKK